MDAPRSRVHRRGMSNRTGFTLLEVALVLLILATLLLGVVPSYHRALDAAAVRGARSELVSAFAVTRATAIRSGGAAIIIDTAAGDVWLETAGGMRLSGSFPLAARYGVTVESDRASPLVLRYDALGIGRLTNAAIRVQRGSARASLTVSAYGRVRT
jgi:prepilin-type N-terminal cleavage/methylation domain-containing protein